VSFSAHFFCKILIFHEFLIQVQSSPDYELIFVFITFIDYSLRHSISPSVSLSNVNPFVYDNRKSTQQRSECLWNTKIYIKWLYSSISAVNTRTCYSLIIEPTYIPWHFQLAFIVNWISTQTVTESQDSRLKTETDSLKFIIFICVLRFWQQSSQLICMHIVNNGHCLRGLKQLCNNGWQQQCSMWHATWLHFFSFSVSAFVWQCQLQNCHAIWLTTTVWKRGRKW